MERNLCRVRMCRMEPCILVGGFGWAESVFGDGDWTVAGTIQETYGWTIMSGGAANGSLNKVGPIVGFHVLCIYTPPNVPYNTCDWGQGRILPLSLSLFEVTISC